jgi:hypothetical protein
MLPREVFLSQASADQPFVAGLATVLQQHGIAVWYAPTEILGAQQWHDEIGAALRRCDWFVIVLSPGALQSMWVKRELMFALSEPRYHNKIVPLLFQACDPGQLSWTLPAYQFVDFSKDFEDGCRALLRIWGLGYRP